MQLNFKKMPIDKFRHGHGPVEISELSEFQRDEILIDISFVNFFFFCIKRMRKCAHLVTTSQKNKKKCLPSFHTTPILALPFL